MSRYDPYRFRLSVLSCHPRHIFCTDCIVQWLRMKDTKIWCPYLCKNAHGLAVDGNVEIQGEYKDVMEGKTTERLYEYITQGIGFFWIIVARRMKAKLTVHKSPDCNILTGFYKRFLDGEGQVEEDGDVIVDFIPL